MTVKTLLDTLVTMLGVTIQRCEHEDDAMRADTMMTELLKRALERAQEPPDEEQDRIGAWILEEIAEEHDEAVPPPDGVDVLERMAAEARAEDEADYTRPLEDVLADYRRHGRFSGV